MNSTGHLIISVVKSAIRMASCVITIESKSIIPMAVGFLIAEILGILEEVVDKR